jgi:hypothetical protein
MGYTSGAKTTYDLLDEIIAALLASSGGYWSDADATWSTTNKTMANLGRRVLKYQNGSEIIYWAFEVINQTNGQNYYYGVPWYYGKGFRITTSATWDSVNHTYPISNNQTFIPFQGHSATMGGDLATIQLTYYLWVESNGNGFTVLFKPEPTGENQQQSTFIVLERNANKEYTDGYSNFYLMYFNNIWGGCLYDANNLGVTSIWLSVCILRPFAYQFPVENWRSSYSPNGNGISFVPNPTYYAFKSSGNGKVYYVKPIINNQANQLSPIFQAELWFPWSESVGLVDGDVIAIEGATTKFLCKALDSPDSTNRLLFAIKYVE